RARAAVRLAAVAARHNSPDWPTDPAAALADPAYAIFFDAAATQQRAAVLERAIAADKHVYCEKPVAPTAAQAHALLRQAQRRGRKHGVVETSCICQDCRNSPPSRATENSAASCPSASNSAGGCSTAASSAAKGRAGIIAAMAAASSSTCTRTGAT